MVLLVSHSRLVTSIRKQNSLWTIRCFVLGLCFLFGGLVGFNGLHAQDIKSLESKKQTLYSELESTNQLLEDIRSSKQTSVSELKVLKEQLKTRQELIATLEKQVNKVQNNINDLGLSIVQKEEDILREQTEYAKMVRHAYRQRGSQQFLVFLLSAETFNDAFRRLQYVKKHNALRLEKVEIIKNQKAELDEQQQTLISEQSEKEGLLTEEANVQKKLIQEQRAKTSLLEDLQSKEAQLARDMESKQVAIETLENQIKQIIRENSKPKVIASKPKATTTKKEPQPTTSTPPAKTSKPEKPEKAKKPEPKVTKTPDVDVTKLSSSFSKNKGKLPWPVSEGVITSRFGQQSHSEISSLKIDNAGIDIATQKGSKAKVVFPGKVRSILFSPVFQSAIIVQHGDYYTVYSNIENVEVEKGQTLKRGDKVGTVYTNKDGVTEIHFEVYKSDVNLNPTSWLGKK